jgi:hypothetical protein
VVTGRTDVLRAAVERGDAYAALQKALEALPADSGARTVAEVDEDVRALEDALVKGQEAVDARRADVDAAREERLRAESLHSKARERVLVLTGNYDRQGRLEREKVALTAAGRQLEEEVDALKAAATALEGELKVVRGVYETVRAESVRMLQAANADVAVMDKALECWTGHLRSVEMYKSMGKGAELERLERHMRVTEERMQRRKEDVRLHTRETETAGDVLREKSAELRNATDNQRYRALKKQLELYEGQARDARHDLERLVTASTRIASAALASADARRRRGSAAAVSPTGRDEAPGAVDDAARAGGSAGRKDWAGRRAISRMEPAALVSELRQQYNERNALGHATRGKAQVYTERWTLKQRDIEEADRMGSMKKYEQCRITKQTMELASSDLDRYHRALDQALMSFHTLKMDTINKSIRELWQTTYRGNDIDEIEIVSDAGGGDGKLGTAAAKRNYNYRVMMRRGDAKLDMRGRCSAGQKVLACLVIRLALAESFCTDCGILALDEPTTNLDRDNVESLAAALRAIIENRRSQANFQLILISHDQEFLSMMSARAFCDNYHLIHKDASGNSVRASSVRSPRLCVRASLTCAPALLAVSSPQSVKEQDIRTLED